MIGLQACIVLVSLVFVGCEHSGDWYNIPNNISAYLNCPLSVSGTFNSTNDDYSCLYSYEYIINVDGRTFEETSDIHNISKYECNVSGSFDVTKSHHVIQFRAIPSNGGPGHNHSSHPAIDVYGFDSLSGPDINPDKSCNCSGELLRWTAPSILPNYEIYYYSIFIKEVNITNQTNNTWIFIPYSDLELHRQYEILISASYCAGQGNETSESIVTSIAPQLETVLNYTFSVINNTTASVSFQAKVSDVQCTVSFPTSVSINISCGDHMIYSKKMDVNVSVDGTILLEDIKVPVDHSYNASLYWNNLSDQPNTSTIVFNTYQLQSCDISSTDDNIRYKCSYANQSVLRGCGIEAINIMNGNVYTSNTTSDNGVINGLCDGTYNVTCYGIPDPTSSDRIIYNDSKYHSLISVNFDIYRLQSCNVSSTDDSIAYKCSYCNRDVLLGCGIEAINIMNGDTNTSNTTSDNGVINGLCDGTYNVTCYGIPDTTSSDRIIYNDNSLISVNGSDCVVSSSMVEPSFTPTIGHDSTESKTNIHAIVLGVVVPIVASGVILFIIASGVIAVVWYFKRKPQNKQENVELKHVSQTLAKPEQETEERQDNIMDTTPSTTVIIQHHNEEEDQRLEVTNIEQTSNQVANKGDVPKGNLVRPKNDRKRHQKPVLETSTDMSRRGSAQVIISKQMTTGSSRRESVKTDKRDVSESERHLMDTSTMPSSQETESLPLEIYQPPQESQPTKTDIVVSEIPKRRLSVVSGGATKYKPALSDSETTKLLQDVSSTSELKSEQYGERHSPPPEGNPTQDKGSIVLQNKTANLDATVTGIIKQYSINEERNESHESQQDTQTTDHPTIIAMQEENSDTANSNLNVNKNI